MSGENDSETLTNSATFFSHVNLILWQTVPPVLLVLGCFGNVMTIVVMRGLRASESTACLSVYFTALALSDLCLLTSSLLWYWPKLVFDTPLSYFNDVSCSVLFFVFYVTSLTSAWFLVAMTCQRMTSVVVPHRVGVLCTVKRGKIITAVILIISCAVNIQMLLNFQVEYVDNSYVICIRKNEHIANIFSMIDLCLASVIPFVILVVSNAVLVSKALQSRHLSRQMTRQKEGDQRSKRQSAKVSSMTTTLTLTSVAFLLLTLPTCVFDVYLELVGYYDQDFVDEGLDAKVTLAESVVVLMWIGNSAVNFYIYVFSGTKFREETKRHLSHLFQRSAA